MEDKDDPKVGLIASSVKQFLLMWAQAAGVLGLGILFVIGVISIVVGLSMMMKFAGPVIGTILLFVLGTLVVTIWGWMSGERP